MTVVCKGRIIYRKNKGFTLIELVVVFAIMAIISAVAVPTYTGHIKKTKEKVCSVNCLQLQRIYETHLAMEKVEHSDLIFEQFLQVYGKNICSEHGEFNYVDGIVMCSVHASENDSKNNDDEDVLFL